MLSPRDIHANASLTQAFRELQQAYEDLQSHHAHMQQSLQDKEHLIHGQQEEIESLRYQLNYYLHRRYGRVSEKQNPEQLSLFDEKEVAKAPGDNEGDPLGTSVTVKGHQRTRQGKKPLSPDLPRVRQTLDIPTEDKVCQGCGHERHVMGEDISEKLDIIPAQCRVIEVVRPKYGCRHCEIGVSQAPLPAMALPKCQATPGLLAHVLVNKYVDHLPLYRQEKLLARTGLEVPRNTLSDWVLKCAEVVTPLWQLLYEQIQNSPTIQADETPVRVLGNPPSRHFMWCYRGYTAEEKPLVLYDYHASRGAQVVKTFLQGFQGWLQSDGYGAYAQVNCRGHAACWAHVRRKYVDVMTCAKKTGIASKMVSLIGGLYGLEKEARRQGLTHEQRGRLRQSQAPPILDAIKTLLETKRHQVPPKSPLGRAMLYHSKLWDKLTLYVQQGRIEIDNNLVENAIRPFALGRRNWLFQGNVRGAKGASVLYSLMMTCKANDIEPYAYFKTVLYRLPKVDPSEYSTLLPFNLAPELIQDAYQQPWV